MWLRKRAGEKKQAEDLHRESVAELKVANLGKNQMSQKLEKEKNFKENKASFCLWNFVDQISQSLFSRLSDTQYICWGHLGDVERFHLCQVNLKDTK